MDVFIGFPGKCHDAKVFAYSTFKNIFSQLDAAINDVSIYSI